MSFEVRSGDLEANLSSSIGTSGVKMDTFISIPLSSCPSVFASP